MREMGKGEMGFWLKADGGRVRSCCEAGEIRDAMISSPFHQEDRKYKIVFELTLAALPSSNV